MLDKESIDTYRSIHLNRDLRCEILTRHENRRIPSYGRFLRPACAFASVLFVSAILLLLPLSSSPALTVNGDGIGRKATLISTESVEYKGGRARTLAISEDPLPLQTAQSCIALEISAGQDVFITIYGAVLLLPDADGVPTFVGQSAAASDGTTVYIPLAGLEESAPVTVSLHDLKGKSLQSYEIFYRDDAQNWYMHETKNK